MNRYEVQADALRRELLDAAPALLSLDPRLERLSLGRDEDFEILLDASRGGVMRLLRVPTTTWRSYGSGHALMVVQNALATLAMVRAWRSMGTRNPPWELVTTNRPTMALLDRAGVDMQDFVDAVWRQPVVHDVFDGIEYWRDGRRAPATLRRTIDPGQSPASLPRGLPWCSGWCTPFGAYAFAFELADGATLRWRPADCKGRVDVPRHALLDQDPADVGIVTELFRDPLLERMEADLGRRLTYASVRRHARTIALRIEDERFWLPVHFAPDLRREILKPELAKVSSALPAMTAMIESRIGGLWRHDHRFEDADGLCTDGPDEDDPET